MRGEPNPQMATVEYADVDSAQRAIGDEGAVLNNRFIKVYFAHGQGAGGAGQPEAQSGGADGRPEKRRRTDKPEREETLAPPPRAHRGPRGRHQQNRERDGQPQHPPAQAPNRASAKKRTQKDELKPLRDSLAKQQGISKKLIKQQKLLLGKFKKCEGDAAKKAVKATIAKVQKMLKQTQGNIKTAMENIKATEKRLQQQEAQRQRSEDVAPAEAATSSDTADVAADGDPAVASDHEEGAASDDELGGEPEGLSFDVDGGFAEEDGLLDFGEDDDDD